MNSRARLNPQAASPPPQRPFTRVHTDLLQRKCACGGSHGLMGECDVHRRVDIFVVHPVCARGGQRSLTAPPVGRVRVREKAGQERAVRKKADDRERGKTQL